MHTIRKGLVRTKLEREPSPRTQPYWHPDLAFPASRTIRNKYLLLKSPSLWYLLWQPKSTKTDVRTSSKNLYVWAIRNVEMKLLIDANQLVFHKANKSLCWSELFYKAEMNVPLLQMIHLYYHEQESLHYLQFSTNWLLSL